MTCYKSLLAFDALLKQYYRLYLKEFSYGGVNDDEFEELKRLFVEACRMAKTLLSDFVRKYDDTDTDDFDVVLERAEHLEVLHYSSCWKKMYHEHLPHVEENRMTPKDRDRVFSAYDLLKIPNYTLAAWIVIEKENGVSGKDNPELLRKLYHYFSEYSPYRNHYFSCSFTTQAEIWHQAINHDYGDIHPDDWEGYVWDYFEKSMEKYYGFDIDSIPIELLDKSFVRYEPYNLGITFRHPLRRITEDIDFRGNFREAKRIILSTYPLSEEQFVIKAGHDGIFAAILISLVENNADVIEQAMLKLGFCWNSPTDDRSLVDTKNRKWMEMRFKEKY